MAGDAPTPPAPDEPAPAGAAPGEEALGVLLALQDEDTRLDQLRHRRATLAERAELEALEARASELAAQRDATGAERERLLARQDELEARVRELEGRMRALDEKLSSGAGASFRDQEAMAAELASLSRQRDALEDEELEVMEAIEPLEAALAQLGADEADLTGRAGDVRRRLADAEAVIDGELAALVARRDALARALPRELAAEYERLRARLGGVGAARVVHGSCSGCHLRLSATQLDEIRRAPAGVPARCEQCGRILVA
ncbi:MAG TPA: C4-type zinc ribbon domain-containing protein [Acidimicrobiales bacterium]|nr:C4-type zinc ribbon domain-containing protein [Acidimicrobiales bacterium]